MSTKQAKGKCERCADNGKFVDGVCAQVDTVYVFGGVVHGGVDNGEQSSWEQLMHVDGTWETVLPAMPQGTRGGVAAVIDDSAFVFGGIHDASPQKMASGWSVVCLFPAPDIRHRLTFMPSCSRSSTF